MKIAILYSGGKDSNYTLYHYQMQGWDISCLITLKSKNEFSYMFQTNNIDITELQSKALEIPLHIEYTDGKKEKELKDLKSAIKKAKEKYNFDAIAVGALWSEYQSTRVNKVCFELGIKVFAPMWHVNQEKIMQTIINNKFEVKIGRIAAYGLTKKYLGKNIDQNTIEDFKKLHKKYGFHIAGEGGEFETFVTNGPNFKQKIIIKDYKIIEHSENEADYIITNAILEPKNKLL